MKNPKGIPAIRASVLRYDHFSRILAWGVSFWFRSQEREPTAGFGFLEIRNSEPYAGFRSREPETRVGIHS